MSYLNAKLADSQFVRLSDTRTGFNGRDALPLLVIDAPFCKAIIALQGAQLLTFQPTGDEPWLWLSPYAQFEQGKSIRGGIPVCLPWFGVNRHHPEKPKHGFVRNFDWELTALEESANSVRLAFSHHYKVDKPDQFSHPFSVTLTITLSRSLTLTLDLHNKDSEPVEFSWAFHTYFAVNDCKKTTVTGLEGRHYLDNTQGLNEFLQEGPIHFIQEVDSVYNETTQSQSIAAQHQLNISGEYCPTCIVWNPGNKAAEKINDIKDAVTHFICLERGCAFSDELRLDAGAIFTSTMTIQKEG